MKKSLILLTSLILLPAPIIALTSSPRPAILSAKASYYTGTVKQIDDLAQQITVKINSKNNGNGSGAIIAKEGDTYYVLTAHHVIGNPDQYTVTTPDNKVYNLTPEEIITISKDNDLAIVKFKSPQNYQIAQIGSYTVENQWLFISGFPGVGSNKQRLLTTGKVRGKEENSFITKDKYSLEGGRGLVYTNLSLKGMSGGPVLDLEGRLVGINTGAENQALLLPDGDLQEINFGYALGVPINTFLGLNSRGSVPTKQLKIINTPPKEIQPKQEAEIKAQLFTFTEPSPQAAAKEWLNYGNELWRSYQYEKAVIAFNRAIKLLENKTETSDKEQLAIAYFGKGLALYDSKKYQAALEPFQKATTVDPKFVQAWSWQGFVLGRLKQYPQALKAYDKAIELNSKNFTLYVEKGDFLREFQRHSDSIKSYTKAITLKPDHSWAYINRGLVYDDLKQYDQALADYNKALTLDPKSALAYNNRGLTYLTQQEYNKALADLNQALTLNPKYVEAYNNRGLTYYNLKQYDQAITDYNQALTLNPKSSSAYYNRGIVHDDLKQYDQALADYNQALTLNPKLTNAYLLRANLYNNSKQYDRAIADYNQALTLDPKSPQAYLGRGFVYLNLKQYAQAILNTEKAAELLSQQGNKEEATKLQKLIQELKKSL